jgi:hypothetical protein
VDNKILFISLTLLLGCKENSKPKARVDEIIRLEAQNCNWLMSLKSLRKSVQPSECVDIEIVRNYFPIYLSSKEFGQNQVQFSIVSASYKNLDHDKVELEVWKFKDKKSYEEVWLPKLASGYGFNEKQINTYDKMLKLRQEYFDDLKKFKR